MSHLTAYIDQFGYLVLFFALMLEMLALPLPGEVLMSYSGFLVFQGHLNWMLSIIMAGLGATIGMTLAYVLGFKLGAPFFAKYGERFHMGQERIEATSRWFSLHGNKLLIIAYFIPGVRHITGYFSGITRIPFKTFAWFAYSGAFLWVAVFITLGKLLGPQWEQFHTSIKKYFVIGSIIAILVFIAIYLYKKYKWKWQDRAIKYLSVILNALKSRNRVAFLLIGTTLVTVGLLILMGGMIQDFIGNEFQDFNEITSLIISLVFSKDWAKFMTFFSFLGSRKVLLSLIALTLLWILWKGRDKVIELISLSIVMLGGEVYEESVRVIFHNLSPAKPLLVNDLFYAFPSEESIMTAIIYGFFVFILIRHSGKWWIHTFAPIVSVFLLFFIAIGHIFLKVDLPSNIAAGYVFGGVWLGLNILLLEILRLLTSMESQSNKN